MILFYDIRTDNLKNIFCLKIINLWKNKKNKNKKTWK